MRRKILLLLVLVAWVPIGCATLDVKVHVYRGPVPVMTKEASLTVDYVLANYSADRRKQTIEAILAQLKPKWPEAVWNDMQDGTNGIASSIKDEWHETDPTAKAAVSQATALAPLLPMEKRLSGPTASRYGDLVAAVRAAEQSRMVFKQRVETALKQKIKDDALPDALLAQSVSEIEKALNIGVRQIAASDEVEGRLVGTPLFDSRIALLSQKDEDWQLFTTNNFAAYWGTAQFVVVREGLLVYHQKSLDFDPTPAAGAGTAVTKLGLKVAAGLATGGVGAIAGLKATKGADGQSAGSQAVSLSSVDEGRIQIDRDKQQRSRMARRNLLMSLANLMERLKTGTKSDGTAPAELKQVIRNEFNSEIDFYKQRISNTLIGR